MTADSIARQMFDAKRQVDDALLTSENYIREDAKADDDARRAKAQAYIFAKTQNPKATVAEIQAIVDLETSDQQFQARLAEGLRRHGYQLVDARKQALSSLQSLASLTRAEAELARWEPSETRTA